MPSVDETPTERREQESPHLGVIHLKFSTLNRRSDALIDHRARTTNSSHQQWPSDEETSLNGRMPRVEYVTIDLSTTPL